MEGGRRRDAEAGRWRTATQGTQEARGSEEDVTYVASSLSLSLSTLLILFPHSPRRLRRADQLRSFDLLCIICRDYFTLFPQIHVGGTDKASEHMWARPG